MSTSIGDDFCVKWSSHVSVLIRNWLWWTLCLPFKWYKCRSFTSFSCVSNEISKLRIKLKQPPVTEINEFQHLSIVKQSERFFGFSFFIQIENVECFAWDLIETVVEFNVRFIRVCSPHFGISRYQTLFSTDTMCLLTNLSVTSYLSSSLDISSVVENLKFRTHAESITFIEVIDCWWPVQIEILKSKRIKKEMGGSQGNIYLQRE